MQDIQDVHRPEVKTREQKQPSEKGERGVGASSKQTQVSSHAAIEREREKPEKENNRTRQPVQ